MRCVFGVTRLSPNARTEDKGSVDEPRARSNCEFDDQTTQRFRVPYHLVEPGVLVVDLILVIAISLMAGIGYNWFFLGVIPAMETYAAIGLLVFTNVCAILAAREDYRVVNLLNFSRQARDLAFIWTFVLFVLIAVIFALKVAETFSRGATFTFFVLGLGGMIAWRALVAQFLKHALSAGGFASRSVILIGERSRLANSRQMLELQRCGYKPIRTFEIGEEDVATTKMSRSLRAKINSAIEVAQAKSVAEIFLLIGWEHRGAIESVSNMLRLVPIPVYLLPDDNITRYLGRATVSVGTTWAAEVQRSPLTRIEQFVKRSIDFVGAALVLLLLSPLMLLAALLIKLDSRGPILFLPDSQWFQRPYVPDREVPDYACAGEWHGNSPSNARRSSGDPGRTLAAPHQHRRAAATLQRAGWKYVPGRTAATRYRPQQRIRDAYRQLCVSPPRQTGNHWLGAGPWPSGRNVGRRPDGKASGIRSMVYCQLEPVAGFQDFVSHTVRCPSVNCLLSHYPDAPSVASGNWVRFALD